MIVRLEVLNELVMCDGRSYTNVDVGLLACNVGMHTHCVVVTHHWCWCLVN